MTVPGVATGSAERRGTLGRWAGSHSFMDGTTPLPKVPQKAQGAVTKFSALASGLTSSGRTLLVTVKAVAIRGS